MHLIHPEHPSSELRISQSGKPAVRPSGGLLSERRLVYFLSGAPSWANRIDSGISLKSVNIAELLDAWLGYPEERLQASNVPGIYLRALSLTVLA